jgi:hypothetical protein
MPHIEEGTLLKCELYGTSYLFVRIALIGQLDTQFETQFHCHWLPLAYIYEQRRLLPAAYFHVALEQVAGEMLDLIKNSLNVKYFSACINIHN